MTRKTQRIKAFQSEMGSRAQVAIRGNVVAVIAHPDGTKEWFYTHNIVTNQGDKYYAMTAVGTAFPGNATDDFKAKGSMRLGTSTATPALKADTDVGSIIPGGSVGLTSGYPRILDGVGGFGDTDNTGGGTNIVSWGFTFGTGVANVNSINEGAVCNNGTTGGTCLTHFFFASSFNKTSSDTLKVFVNHTMSGT